MRIVKTSLQLLGLSLIAIALVACDHDDSSDRDGAHLGLSHDGEEACGEGAVCYESVISLAENSIGVGQIVVNYGVTSAGAGALPGAVTHLEVTYYDAVFEDVVLYSDAVVAACELLPIGDSLRNSTYFHHNAADGLAELATGLAAADGFAGCHIRIEDNVTFQVDPEARLTLQCDGVVSTPEFVDFTTDIVTTEVACAEEEEGCSEDKVRVCHIPPGNPANAHEICISPNAVDKHIANHGDYVLEDDEVCGEDDGDDGDEGEGDATE